MKKITFYFFTIGQIWSLRNLSEYLILFCCKIYSAIFTNFLVASQLEDFKIGLNICKTWLICQKKKNIGGCSVATQNVTWSGFEIKTMTSQSKDGFRFDNLTLLSYPRKKSPV